MVGYQGGFNAEGDSAGQGGIHWARGSAIPDTETNVNASILFIATFDEVNEATTIFKSTNEPLPSGGKRFLTYEGLLSDHYP